MSATRIALIGAPGTGKTTVGKAWLDLHRVNADDFRPKIYSFANAVKWELAQMLGALSYDEPLVMFKPQVDPATKDQFRSLQQALGSFRRADDPDYWLKISLVAIDADSRQDLRDKQTTYMVVDDCRFPNEEMALRERGFVFVLLQPGATTRTLSPEQAAHESEQYWPKWHADIVLPYRDGPKTQALLLDNLLKGESIDGFV